MKGSFQRVSMDPLRESFLSAIEAAGSPAEKLQRVCDLLMELMPQCQWAGYYMAAPSGEPVLLLGPYAGPATDHVRIAFGEGICGQAAGTGETFVIDDVSLEDNYLSCSVDVRSEIVIPVFSSGELVGELDLDSHYPGGFDEGDREFLQWLVELTAVPAGLVRASMGEDGSRE